MQDKRSWNDIQPMFPVEGEDIRGYYNNILMSLIKNMDAVEFAASKLKDDPQYTNVSAVLSKAAADINNFKVYLQAGRDGKLKVRRKTAQTQTGYITEALEAFNTFKTDLEKTASDISSIEHTGTKDEYDALYYLIERLLDYTNKDIEIFKQYEQKNTNPGFFDKIRQVFK